MDSEDKFWLSFWKTMSSVILALILSFPMYYGYRSWLDLQLQQGGYSAAEVFCKRRAGSSTGNALICRDVFSNKVDHDAAIEELRGE